MQKFRKKPVVIDAVQWDGKMPTLGFLLVDDPKVEFRPSDGSLRIETLEGKMEARIGDWIIRGVEGELYPCKPDIFAKTYEPV